jgi:hypothetical protein
VQRCKKILELPKEMILQIRNYLPYEVKNELIQQSCSTRSLLEGQHLSVVERLFWQFCINKEFLTILNIYEAKNQIPDLEKSIPYWNHLGDRKITSSNMMNKVLYIINLAKERNPKFAYHMLSFIHIIINKNKKYKLNEENYLYEEETNYFGRIKLSLDDLPMEENIFPYSL